MIALIVVCRKKKIINTQEKEKLLQELKIAKESMQVLTDEIDSLTKTRDIIEEDIHSLNITIAKKTEQCKNLDEKEKSSQERIKQLQETANSVYDVTLKEAQNKFDLQIEKVAENFQNQKDEYEDEYFKTLEEFSKDLNEQVSAGNASLNELNQQLNRMKSIVHAAIEEQKRQASNIEEKEFYKLQISEIDLKEIQKIRDILSYMRNERPLCKAIWESYYRTPCNELIDRIIANKQASGIYKITNLLNLKSYIGQAINLSERIKTHVKAGLGIDTPNSILYKSMKKYGVENFTFEIIEYCSPTDLNDRERTWINYFNTQEWGYNMTSGGSRNV